MYMEDWRFLTSGFKNQEMSRFRGNLFHGSNVVFGGKIPTVYIIIMITHVLKFALTNFYCFCIYHRIVFTEDTKALTVL